MTAHDEKVKMTTYFVNGEEETTSEHKLTVRAILTNAGFTPVTDYQLVRDNGNKVLSNLDQEEPIHEGERFTALFKAPTPVS